MSAAGLGCCPFFVWHSLPRGTVILERGCVWKIGNGESINVYNDAWIFTSNYVQILYFQTLNPNTRVYSLVSLFGCLNLHLVCTHFQQEEADATYPSQRRSQTDKLAWHCFALGVYFVKSRYWLARRLGNDAYTCGLSASNLQIWQRTMETVYSK